MYFSLFDKLLRFSWSNSRTNTILRKEINLSPQDSSSGVQLFNREIHATKTIITKSSKKSRTRRYVPHADSIVSSANYRWRAKGTCGNRSGTAQPPFKKITA